MAYLDITWDDRRHHRPERSVILGIQQGDAHIFGPTQQARQLPRGSESSESTADDEDLCRGIRVAGFERGEVCVAACRLPRPLPMIGPPNRQFASHLILVSAFQLLSLTFDEGLRVRAFGLLLDLLALPHRSTRGVT